MINGPPPFATDSLNHARNTLLSRALTIADFLKVVLYVEQEPASGPRRTSANRDGGSDSNDASRTWTVADALTEPMVAGPSASTPEAKRHSDALLAVRAYWEATAETQEAPAITTTAGPEKDAAENEAEEKMAHAMDLMGGADGAGWELDERLEELAARLDVGTSRSDVGRYRRCPAARGSAWRSRPRWRSGRTSSCSTSRRTTSIGRRSTGSRITSTVGAAAAVGAGSSSSGNNGNPGPRRCSSSRTIGTSSNGPATRCSSSTAPPCTGTEPADRTRPTSGGGRRGCRPRTPSPFGGRRPSGGRRRGTTGGRGRSRPRARAARRRIGS
mmetsp:Transcript_20067/g.48237  ORF Transcript_20067/g.48237 Transcript_20067/m.48237 type:complete len:329 (+) Transcript_20067:216-1202(+)